MISETARLGFPSQAIQLATQHLPALFPAYGVRGHTGMNPKSGAAILLTFWFKSKQLKGGRKQQV